MRTKIVWVFSLSFLLLLPAFSTAAPHPERISVIAQAKADLTATGRTFTTACDAFAIVELAAWRMRDEGAGLLDKPGGNNCRGFAVDIIAYPDGAIYDVLIAQTVQNVPAWQVPGAGVVDPSRYRAAHDPEFDTLPPTPPTPPTPPVPPSSDIGPRLDVLQSTLYNEIHATRVEVAEMRASLEEHRKVSRSLYDRALGVLKDPRTITMVLGVLAGRYVVPGGK